MRRTVHKVLAIVLAAAFVAIQCACASTTARKAYEEGKLSMAKADYTAAMNYFKLAKDEGFESAEMDEVIIILDGYIKAEKAYDKGDIDDAEELIDAIPESYKEYSVAGDIDDLKELIEGDKKASEEIDDMIAKARKDLSRGEYEDVSDDLDELYSKELSDEQRDEVDEIRDTLNKINENKKVVYVAPQPPKIDYHDSGNTNVIATYYVVNCQNYITLRSAPSTSASSLAHIPLGKAVGYIENAGNGFYKINYDGKVGYSLAAYLSPNKETTASTSSSDTVIATYYVVNCQSYITLRSTPSTSASSLAHIPLGAEVGYIGNASNGFYKIKYDGKVGYGLASYLSSTKPAKPTSAPAVSGKTAKVVNAKEFITLRNAPSTSASEITKIPLGAYVTYLGSASNGFYNVEYNGFTGYALASYLQIQ